jgi:hypothetical protein
MYLKDSSSFEKFKIILKKKNWNIKIKEIFNYKDYKTNEIKIMSLHSIEFIRRFTMYILPKGFVKMRWINCT